VRPMHDDSVLVAIDEALRSPAFCACGSNLTIAIRGNAAWLECTAFSRPSRLPKPLATFVNEMLHDRRFVIELPAPVPGEALPAARPAAATRTAPAGA
jgi:hypothetical protein